MTTDLAAALSVERDAVLRRLSRLIAAYPDRISVDDMVTHRTLSGDVISGGFTVRVDLNVIALVTVNWDAASVTRVYYPLPPS